MANKMTVDFDGMRRLQRQLESISSMAMVSAVEIALIESQKVIARKSAAAMQPHNRTGKTAASIIKDGQVEWTGDTASISVGYDFNNGGKPSVFLMHGNGTEKFTGDKAVFDAVYGSATRKEIKKVQEQAFNEVLREVMKE